ncbi:PGF-pre-PGF domain-containing protein [archaeon]|nr:PGF-pre-PGF domain-containing protein [archaeon]
MKSRFFSIFFIILIITPIVYGNSTDPPAYVLEVGYDNLTFFDDFDSNDTIDFDLSGAEGFNWYPQDFFGSPTTPSNEIQISESESLLTLHGDNFSKINSAVYGDGPLKVVGHTFSGGGYFEANISFDIALYNSSQRGGPAFWSMAAEHMGSDSPEDAQWPGQEDWYKHFIEVDFLEYFVGHPQGPDTYHASIIDWYGFYDDSVECPGIGLCDSNNMEVDSSDFLNNIVEVPTDTNFNQSHTYGALWVPSLDGEFGYVQFYFDGEPTTSNVTWVGSPQNKDPPPGPGTPWTFSIIDQNHLVISLYTGGGIPMSVDWVRVFQSSETLNTCFNYNNFCQEYFTYNECLTPPEEICDLGRIDEDCDGEQNEDCECNDIESEKCKSFLIANTSSYRIGFNGLGMTGNNLNSSLYNASNHIFYNTNRFRNGSTNLYYFSNLNFSSLALESDTSQEEIDNDNDEGGSSGGSSSYSSGSSINKNNNSIIDQEKKSWVNIPKNKMLFFDIQSNLINIINVSFNVINFEKYIQLQINKHSELPKNISLPNENLIDIFSIDKYGITNENITDIKIKFYLKKLEYKNIQTENVNLLRYNGKNWEKLNTKLVNEDLDKLFFEAKTPGFSYFVIVSNDSIPKNISTENNINMSDEEKNQPKIKLNSDLKINDENNNNNINNNFFIVYLVLFLFLFSLILFKFYKNNNKLKIAKKILNPWILIAKKYGFSNLQIKEKLIENGWKPNLIKRIFQKREKKK